MPASESPSAQADTPPNPCRDCEYNQDCAARVVLDDLVYGKPGFRRPQGATFLNVVMPPETVARVASELDRIVEAWLSTVAAVDAPSLTSCAHSALFDYLVSGLYAAIAFDASTGRMVKEAYVHETDDGRLIGFYPYTWMCPGCVVEGVAPSDAYIVGGEFKPRDRKTYPVYEQLSRPVGRMIGDLGAWCVRAIIRALAPQGAHFAAGGGHRGEFDLIVSTEELLILGETKASPLVAFPLAIELPTNAADPHTWVDAHADAQQWNLFVGAAPEGQLLLPISPPGGETWPLPDLLSHAQDAAMVTRILRAWRRHLDGYRVFNAEDPTTRWLRFGCGNIGTGLRDRDQPRELRVDNTKNLPGIDRTDDIKKGITQVMLFGRLKRGCKIGAVKTVLFGNLYAETHHEHYVKPLASLQLQWPNHDSVWLFDGIVAMSRNILNDHDLRAFLAVEHQPYVSDELTPEDLEAGLEGLDVDG